MNYTITSDKIEPYLIILRGVMSKNLTSKIQELLENLETHDDIYELIKYSEDYLPGTNFKAFIISISDKVDLQITKEIPQEIIDFQNTCLEEVKFLCG